MSQHTTPTIMTISCGHWSFGFILEFAVFLATSTIAASQGVDRTIQPNERGKDVVEATLARFDSFKTVQKLSSVIGDEFLRRVAYVETKFGMDGNTFRDGYDGGIWQIDEDNLELTKSSQLADVLDLRAEIEDRFQIVWIEVPWVNLRKPLYSALAARLLISTFPTGPPPSAQIDLQAAYWKQHYDTPNGPGTKSGFINDVKKLLDSEQCFLSKLDLAFVVDGSGSVTKANFDISRQFVQGMVEKFEVGPDRIRVGLIQYSSSPSIEFGLNTYTDKEELLSAIGNVVYQSGSTLTGSAINAMVSDLFGEGKGARNIDEVPRVGIIMTDGKSSEDVLGPANAARAEGITLFAIGIGKFDPEELKEIANDPDDKYVFEVNNFNVVANIESLISREACEEPLVFGNTNLGKPTVQTLQALSRVNLEYQLPPSNVMTITMNATKGEISAYFSTKVTKPNPAFHQWSANASEANPIAQVFINATEENPSRQKRQAEQQQVYGTIINTYNVSTSDMSVVNGTDVNATSAIPETVFTLVAEEGDTRIVIPTTMTTPTYTTSRTTTPGYINTITTGYTTSMTVAPANASKESRLSAGGVAGIVIAIFITLIIIVVCVAVYLIKRRATEVKTDAEATNMTQVSITKADTDTETDSMQYKTTKVNQEDIAQADSKNVDETQKLIEETPPTKVLTGETPTKKGNTDPEVDIRAQSEPAYDDNFPQPDGEAGTNNPEAERLVSDTKATE